MLQYISNVIGVSPSGKAKDFDSFIRKFESCYPCQQKAPALAVGAFCWLWIALDSTYRLPCKRVSSQSPHGALQARLQDEVSENLRLRRIPCYSCPCGRCFFLSAGSARFDLLLVASVPRLPFPHNNLVKHVCKRNENRGYSRPCECKNRAYLT